MKKYDLVIIGSGPAGLSAAIYAARAALEFIVIESLPMSGGQIINTSDVDNYPGLPMISGWDLAQKMREHAQGLGAEFVNTKVTEIKKSEDGYLLKCSDGTEYNATAVIAAMGAAPRMLNIPGEKEYRGRGVSYCATCDGNFFKNKVTAVIGGGDTAMEDVLYLSGLCTKVYLIHRRDTFRAAKSLVEKVKSKENIEIITNTVPKEIKGAMTVEKIVLEKEEKETEIDVNGVFIAAGVMPSSDILKELVSMDDNGYVIAGENCATNSEGIFVAGDLRKKNLRQILTAAADGANAVNSAVEYIQKN